MRVRFIKDNKYHKAGDVADVSKNVAFGLIDSGVAVISKDMTGNDMQTLGKIKKVKRRG